MKNKKCVKNLIFDFGKVLVDYDFEAFFKRNILDADKYWALNALLNNEMLQQLVDREEKPFEDIMEDVISKNKALEHEIRTFVDLYPTIVTGEVPGMFDLLKRLKEKGYKLYGLTNWCSKVHITMRQFPIFNLLDGQIISSEEHLIKPEPAIYQRLFERFGLKPEECVFTDDKVVNIEGGKEFGMKGIVFIDTIQYERELRTIIESCKND